MLCPYHPLGATSAAPTTTTAAERGIRVIITAGLTSRADGNRDSLHNAAMVVARRVHTVVDGEIAANQVRAHSGTFAGEDLGFIGHVCLILAVVYANHACVA